MTDEPDSPLTPAQEDEVRRLLAESRHDEPMPADVADRMDRVLADLAAEPVRRAPVTHLADRRRRVASLLVAAAAVVVIGIGLGQVVGAGGGGDGDHATAGGSAADSAEEEAAPNAARGENDAPTDGGESQSSLRRDYVQGKVFDVRGEELSEDLDRVQEYAARRTTSVDENKPQDAMGYLQLGKGCATRGLGAGTFVRVRYDGDPGVVVLRRPAGDTQVADVYLCGADDPVRSVTLPLP